MGHHGQKLIARQRGGLGLCTRGLFAQQQRIALALSLGALGHVVDDEQRGLHHAVPVGFRDHACVVMRDARQRMAVFEMQRERLLGPRVERPLCGALERLRHLRGQRRGRERAARQRSRCDIEGVVHGAVDVHAAQLAIEPRDDVGRVFNQRDEITLMPEPLALGLLALGDVFDHADECLHAAISPALRRVRAMHEAAAKPVRIRKLHLEVHAPASESLLQVRQDAGIGFLAHHVADQAPVHVFVRQAEPLGKGPVGKAHAAIGIELHERKRHAVDQPLQLELRFGQRRQRLPRLCHVFDHADGVGRRANRRRHHEPALAHASLGLAIADPAVFQYEILAMRQAIPGGTQRVVVFGMDVREPAFANAAQGLGLHTPCQRGGAHMQTRARQRIIHPEHIDSLSAACFCAPLSFGAHRSRPVRYGFRHCVHA